MSNLKRFGRKLPVPSTRQIRHELIVLGLADAATLKEWTDNNVGLDLNPPALDHAEGHLPGAPLLP